jgi:amidohydrolase
MIEALTTNFTKIGNEVDRRSMQLRQIALEIHDNPELAFNEYKAVELLTAPLEANGFKIEKGISNMETAFIATYEGSSKGPTIGLLAEYDALRGLGHACGHNLIGTASVGAALALKDAFDSFPGKIKVIGTPAEEGGGGKVIMANDGVFDDLDIAMMAHPKNKSMVLRGGLACTDITLKFYGKESHASSAPEEGISALDAVIQSFVSINSLRQFFTDDVRVHGIITKGGDAPNIVPGYCEAEFIIRAQTRKKLTTVKEKVLRAVNGAVNSVGAKLEVIENFTYAERNNNVALANGFKRHLESLGLKVDDPPEQGGIGSSDIGNVGHIVPTIHPYFKIGNHMNHTHEFREDASSEEGLQGMEKAAKALAMTAYEVCVDDGFLKEIKQEFKEWKHKHIDS